MKTTALATVLAASLASACLAQSETDPSPEKAAVLELDRAYEVAFARGDSAALAGFFAEDAVYTTEDAAVLRGRDAIEQSIRDGLKANKGAKLTIALDAVRRLAPDVVVETGKSTVTAKDGETRTSLYTAIYVRRDDKWKIGQLIETALPPLTPHERLQELAWLVGEWEEVDKTGDLSVRSQYVWARGGSFLTRNVTVKRAGDTTLEGWQIIGWDPVEECIRSWTFDSEGGFAEGRWTRDGERWLLRQTGVAPDGSRTGDDQTLTRLGPDRIAWESYNRTLDGHPEPNIGRIEINRVQGN